jgi:hypothetical protein
MLRAVRAIPGACCPGKSHDHRFRGDRNLPRSRGGGPGRRWRSEFATLAGGVANSGRSASGCPVSGYDPPEASSPVRHCHRGVANDQPDAPGKSHLLTGSQRSPPDNRLDQTPFGATGRGCERMGRCYRRSLAGADVDSRAWSGRSGPDRLSWRASAGRRSPLAAPFGTVNVSHPLPPEGAHRRRNISGNFSSLRR